MILIKRNPPIALWLWIVSFMVLCMVLIGGVTRLTDSGLSMVDWKPIMGAVPPLNDTEWNKAFDMYKAYPEFQKVNFDMDLDGFKSIFFWEYFHRLFGRLIGLAFFLPYLYFLVRKRLNPILNIKLVIALLLGGSQGLMGWYMVKSGLVDRPDVSHFRLAAHLGLAFLILGYLYWIILEVKNQFATRVHRYPYKKTIIVFSVLVALQIIYGAFVAGLDAGLTHNTFPKMGRNWIPPEFWSVFTHPYELIHNPVVIQFVHRIVGVSIAIYAFFMWRISFKSHLFLQKCSMQMIFVIVMIQVFLGVMTLLHLVPIALASAHQIVAALLLLLVVRMWFFSFHRY